MLLRFFFAAPNSASLTHTRNTSLVGASRPKESYGDNTSTCRGRYYETCLTSQSLMLCNGLLALGRKSDSGQLMPSTRHLSRARCCPMQPALRAPALPLHPCPWRRSVRLLRVALLDQTHLTPALFVNSSPAEPRSITSSTLNNVYSPASTIPSPACCTQDDPLSGGAPICLPS